MTMHSIPTQPIVFVIANDVSVSASLQRLIRCEGWLPRMFQSAREFMEEPRLLVMSCLILTLHGPDSNDLKVQKQVAQERPEIPIIVMSEYRDIPTTVQVIKAGALDFLVKPFSDDVLVAAMRQGLEQSGVAIGERTAVQALQERYASLSLREQQVMTLVVQGRLNKLIGNELGISEITVKAHRGKVMRKMDADSLPALVHMAVTLGLTASTGRTRSSDLSPHLQPWPGGQCPARRPRGDNLLNAAIRPSGYFGASPSLPV